jgi:hypothetical protein
MSSSFPLTYRILLYITHPNSTESIRIIPTIFNSIPATNAALENEVVACVDPRYVMTLRAMQETGEFEFEFEERGGMKIEAVVVGVAVPGGLSGVGV